MHGATKCDNFAREDCKLERVFEDGIYVLEPFSQVENGTPRVLVD